MEIITVVDKLQKTIEGFRLQGKTIGFVPTMGALHAGHLSLVKQCIADNDVCIVSIFVNPTQFNNKEDLLKYPRTLDRDCELLDKAGVAIVFAPPVEEVYPEPDTRQFDFGQLDKVMEGKYRPGHFNGVAQVVSRLFDIVKPDRAYFGEKDFQQIAVIRSMVKMLDLPVDIVSMPIIREESGLALSSRNERLDDTAKNLAVNISKVLFSSREWVGDLSPVEVAERVVRAINNYDVLQVEYYEIVDGYNLQPIESWTDSNYIVGCITVFCGEVRLIDNIIYKG